MMESILKFKVGGKTFGVDSETVSQILRVSDITPVPLTNDVFRGVSVVGGKIVSVVDVGLCLDLDKTDKNSDTARLITFNHKEDIYALLVGEVLGITLVESENYEPSTDDNVKIVGYYKENGEICQIIDIEEILKDIEVLGFSADKIEKFVEEETEEGNINEDYLKFLFFRIGGELFAIDIDKVKELVFVPDSVTPVPESKSYVLGMITLRDKIINALDLSALFGFGGVKKSSQNRLIIVQNNSKKVAFCVDLIEEVKDVEKSAIEYVPENFKDKRIEAIYKDRSGEIASIISGTFLKEVVDDYYLDEEVDNSNPQKEYSSKENFMIEVVIFSIGKEEFAIDISNVQEIIRYSNATPMPDSPEFVEGVINLRGVVIPIVSLQERLGFEKNITDKTKTLICNIQDSKVGFLVDDVKEILSVEESSLSTTKSNDALFDEIITLDNGERVILKIKINRLFNDDDLERLKMVENKDG